MTAEQLAEVLRPVIEQVVRKCMQEELREILTEAVEIASRPSGNIAESSNDSFEIEDTPRQPRTLTRPDWVQELDEKHAEAEAELPKPVIRESKKKGKPAVANPTTEEEYEHQKNVLAGLLGDTARNMTAADRNNFSGGGI